MEQEIITAIGSVGFPIVACCAMFWLYNETITKITATLDKLNETLNRIEARLDMVEDKISDIAK